MPVPVTIKGRRRWYAPWLRHPDRVVMRETHAERTARMIKAMDAHHRNALADLVAPNNALLDRLKRKER